MTAGPARLSVRPPLALGTALRSPAHGVFPLDHPDCRLFARARHAMFVWGSMLDRRGRDEVLVPAYHHGSEVEAFQRAGLVCRFYGLDEQLRPDPISVEDLMGSRTVALHLIHYLGFPQDEQRWRRWCDERDVLLVSDAAQAFLAHDGDLPVGALGDLTVFCLYKTFGLPDGAAALAHPALPAPVEESRVGLTGLGKRYGAWVAQEHPGLLRFHRDNHAAASADEENALGEPGPPARTSVALLARVLDASASASRRAAYRALQADLGALVAAPFATLPDGASPFLLPVAVPDKAPVLAALRSRGVNAVDLWSAPHPTMPAGRFPFEEGLRRSLIGLPVHQELRPRHLRTIADATLEATRG